MRHPTRRLTRNPRPRARRMQPQPSRKELPSSPSAHASSGEPPRPPPRPPPEPPPEPPSRRSRRIHDSMPSWKASLARRTAALMARFFARSAHNDDRKGAFQMQASGHTATCDTTTRATRARAATRDTATRARALTFSSLVDACGRALVGFAVRQPQATAVLPLVAPWALRIARTIVIVRPSSLFRACLGTLAHELLESPTCESGGGEGKVEQASRPKSTIGE